MGAKGARRARRRESKRASLRGRSIPNSRFCLKYRASEIRGHRNGPPTCGDEGCHRARTGKCASDFKQKREFGSERGSDFTRFRRLPARHPKDGPLPSRRPWEGPLQPARRASAGVVECPARASRVRARAAPFERGATCLYMKFLLHWRRRRSPPTRRP